MTHIRHHQQSHDLSIARTRRKETPKCIIACDQQIPEWYETFDQILKKLKHPSSGDFMAQFVSVQTNNERIKLCLRNRTIISKIIQYLKDCSDVLNKTCGCFGGQKKMAQKAADYRVVGNLEFVQQRNLEAWTSYSRALVYAPRDSEEAPLAYGNRSAVYFCLKQFENAIEDIDCALKLNFDKYKPASKLLLRKAECLIRLGRVVEAQNLLSNEARHAECQSADWYKLVKACKDADFVMVKVRENANRLKNLKMAIDEHYSTFTPQDQLNSLSTKVAIRFDPTKGHHLVAKEAISAGDTVTVSQPFVSLMAKEPEIQLNRCHHCMSACFPQTYWENSSKWVDYPRMSNPAPCFNCANVIYCSEACRIISWSTYHQFECGQLAILYKLQAPPFDLHLALRMAYSAGALSINKSTADSFKKLSSPIYLDDPVTYSHVYGMKFSEKSTGMNDLLKQCVSACLLTKLSELSGFVQDPTEQVFAASTFLRHLLQCRANPCSFTKQLASPYAEPLLTANPSTCTFSLIDPIVTLMKHSATPNLTFEPVIPFDYFYLQSNIMECKAIRDIEPDEELTINYITAM